MSIFFESHKLNISSSSRMFSTLVLAVFTIFIDLSMATCPSTQSPYAPGCSTCTECCIFQFGQGTCATSVLWDGIVRDPACNSISAREQVLGIQWNGSAAPAVDHIWISECTGSFASCTLYNTPDCSGDTHLQIDNTANMCHVPGWDIWSFDCQFR